MLKIPTDTIVPVLKHAVGEYKYLSPNVYKIKNGYKFSDKASVNDFINRDSDGAQTFFRELVSALSNRHSYVIEDLRKEFFET